MSLVMERREYCLSSFGRGARFGGPPMSAIRGFPERPGEARLNGGRRRSGQGMMETETSRKLEERVVVSGCTRSANGGGERGYFWTDQGVILGWEEMLTKRCQLSVVR